MALSLPVAPLAAQEQEDAAVNTSRAPQTCQRVNLADAATGEPVIGVEDIVVNPADGQVYLSAYNRWALEDAIEADADKLPQGAIYVTPLKTLKRQPKHLPLRRLAADRNRRFHPHGLALHLGETERLFAINHAYRREDGGWSRRTRLEAYDITADGLRHVSGGSHPALCQANNLTALSAQDLLVTRDHGACNRLGRWLENILGLDRGQVVLASLNGDNPPSLETLVADIGYANGIALAPDGSTLAVAATRDQHIRFYNTPALLSGAAKALKRTVGVDGGPDNISWAPDGRLIAAVHPSLLDVGMARLRWFGAHRAGTKAIALTPETAVTETLVHDTEGKLLNAGTGAVLFEETLVVSGVLDDALLVCRPGSS